MVKKYYKITIVIALAGAFSIFYKTELSSSDEEIRNPDQSYIFIAQIPEKTGENEYMTAILAENESPVNAYSEESSNFDALYDVCNFNELFKKYCLYKFSSVDYLLLQNINISELDLPPPMIS